MKHDPVVVTGMGVVTPLGTTLDSTFGAMSAGRSGVGRITRFDPEGLPVQIAGEVPGGDDLPAPPNAPGADRKVRYAWAAAREAWRSAGFSVPGSEGGRACPVPPHRRGVSLGSEGGRKLLEDVAERWVAFRGKGLPASFPDTPRSDYPNLWATRPASVLSALLDLRGPCRTSATACTSGSQALGRGLRLLQRGQADLVLAGGSDTLVEVFMLTGFSLLGALSTRNDAPKEASRPFDRDRDGFVLGEGAGFVVLERLSSALKRGAKPLGELAGYGATLNAWRITDSPPDGRGAAQSMAAALDDAGLQPSQVDYINAHGTSTVMNDASETRAVHRVFGESAHQLAISSSKSQLGHLVAAGGAVEAILALEGMRRGIILPTLNLTGIDPDCDLDYVPQAARASEHAIALSNSFGFGGSNATLALRRFD